MKLNIKANYETPTACVVELLMEQTVLAGSGVEKDSAAFTSTDQNKVSIW